MPRIHEAPVACSPADVNYNSAAIDRLDTYLQSLISDKKLQCASYLLARNGKIFAHKSMGPLTHKEKSSDLMPDSLRGIASISKAFTAVAIMQLVEQGKIFVHQPVSEILPEFDTPHHRKIEIFHLLTHTSGLPADPGYFLEPYPNETFWKQMYEKEWLTTILTGPLQSVPGKIWSYCSAGFMVLGEIIARVSGVSYEEYVRANLFAPLGLTDTYVVDTPLSLLDRICFTSDDDEKSFLDNQGKTSPLYACGGIDSTLLDLYRFGAMLLDKGKSGNQQILSRKSVETMTRNHMTGQPAFFWGADLPSRNYGLGVDVIASDLVTPGTFGHEGSGRSTIYVDPAERLVAVWYVPTPLDFVWESLFGIKAIIWSGLQ